MKDKKIDAKMEVPENTPDPNIAFLPNQEFPIGIAEYMQISNKYPIYVKAALTKIITNQNLGKKLRAEWDEFIKKMTGPRPRGGRS